MLSFDWWWAMVLLPLPWLVRTLWPAVPRTQTALYVPFLARVNIPKTAHGITSQLLARVLVWTFWVCLVIAAARPYWLGEPVARTASGRDMMLAVDVSGSMQEADMVLQSKAVARIEVLKNVVGEFIQRREGDRLGLTLFGTNAYVYVPLTFDLDTLNELLQGISTGLAGRRTAIADAIGVAIRSLREQASEHKVLILVTDGNNTAGTSDPLKAARAARYARMIIYTIGIGNDAETLRRTYGISNIPDGAALDEPNLRKIAAITGGRYFRATDSRSLQQIYAELDELEPVDRQDRNYRPRIEFFHLPLSLGLIGLLSLIIWSIWKNRPNKQSDG